MRNPYSKTYVVGKSIEEYRKLVSYLKSQGIRVEGFLNNLEDDDHVPAVVIDMDSNTACVTSVTIMACRAAGGNYKPLTVEEYISG